MLLRTGVWVAGLVALLVAAPEQLRTSPHGLVVLAVFAALPALMPDGPWPTLLALAAVAAWLAATSWAAQPITVWRVLALAASLYLLHTLAALAGAVPYDAAVAPDVVARWLARALAVVAVSSLLSAAVLAGTARVTTGGYQVATVVGLAAAAGLAASLSLAARRAAPDRVSTDPDPEPDRDSPG